MRSRSNPSWADFSVRGGGLMPEEFRNRSLAARRGRAARSECRRIRPVSCGQEDVAAEDLLHVAGYPSLIAVMDSELLSYVLTGCLHFLGGNLNEPPQCSRHSTL